MFTVIDTMVFFTAKSEPALSQKKCKTKQENHMSLSSFYYKTIFFIQNALCVRNMSFVMPKYIFLWNDAS